eukprot:Amastigsp_a846541_10.p1 type:complete len:576 gc:universal Amastigsp_a846541_10:107-1834(+)
MRKGLVVPLVASAFLVVLGLFLWFLAPSPPLFWIRTPLSSDGIEQIPDSRLLSLVAVVAVCAVSAGTALLFRHWTQAKQSMGHSIDPYDVVVGIDRIDDILNTGWSVLATRRVLGSDELVIVDEMLSGRRNAVVVSILGDFNVGKTYLLSLLAGVQFASGHMHSTPGLSIKATSSTQNVIYMDSQGAGVPRRQANIASYRAGESLIRELLIEHSNVQIVVVSKYDLNWQAQISEIVAREGGPRDSDGLVMRKRVFVVHNLVAVRTKAELDYYVTLLRTSLEDELGSSQLESDGGDSSVPYFFQETHPKRTAVKHCFLVNDMCDLGKTHNPQVIQKLRISIDSLFSRKFNVLHDLHACLQAKLPTYLGDLAERVVFESSSPEGPCADSSADAATKQLGARLVPIGRFVYNATDVERERIRADIDRFQFVSAIGPPLVLSQFNVSYDIQLRSEDTKTGSVTSLYIVVDSPGMTLDWRLEDEPRPGERGMFFLLSATREREHLAGALVEREHHAKFGRAVGSKQLRFEVPTRTYDRQRATMHSTNGVTTFVFPVQTGASSASAPSVVVPVVPVVPVVQ